MQAVILSNRIHAGKDIEPALYDSFVNGQVYQGTWKQNVNFDFSNWAAGTALAKISLSDIGDQVQIVRISSLGRGLTFGNAYTGANINDKASGLPPVLANQEFRIKTVNVMVINNEAVSTRTGFVSGLEHNTNLSYNEIYTARKYHRQLGFVNSYSFITKSNTDRLFKQSMVDDNNNPWFFYLAFSGFSTNAKISLEVTYNYELLVSSNMLISNAGLSFLKDRYVVSDRVYKQIINNLDQLNRSESLSTGFKIAQLPIPKLVEQKASIIKRINTIKKNVGIPTFRKKNNNNLNRNNFINNKKIDQNPKTRSDLKNKAKKLGGIIDSHEIVYYYDGNSTTGVPPKDAVSEDGVVFYVSTYNLDVKYVSDGLTIKPYKPDLSLAGCIINYERIVYFDGDVETGCPPENWVSDEGSLFYKTTTHSSRIKFIVKDKVIIPYSEQLLLKDTQEQLQPDSNNQQGDSMNPENLADP